MNNAKSVTKEIINNKTKNEVTTIPTKFVTTGNQNATASFI